MTLGARLGVLGGTFDPIHRGHLDAARAARAALALDTVVFVPARVPPHRPPPVASGHHRFAMVALAIHDDPALLLADLELRSPGPSYTSNTLRRLHARGYAPSQLFFITGADAFAEITTWHDYPAVLDGTHFVVISRPGYAHHRLPARLPALAPRFVDLDTPDARERDVRVASGRTAVFLVAAPTADVSATEARRRLSTAESLEGLMPDPVAEYARRHRLYAASRSPADLLHDED